MEINTSPNDLVIITDDSVFTRAIDRVANASQNEKYVAAAVVGGAVALGAVWVGKKIVKKIRNSGNTDVVVEDNAA